mmetsp:Transcript_14008/g.28725  ORF Transcript_14008/g.28725 Transcript_14008/m.28725 type:complete len:250 (-) Transcript_14008:275-1024(-)
MQVTCIVIIIVDVLHSNGSLHVCSGASHSDRHRKPLHHFVGARADAVQPHHPLLLTRQHEFEPRRHLGVFGVESKLHGGKRSLLRSHVFRAKLFHRLRLRQADGADGGVAEDHRRDALVLDPCVGLPAEQAVCQPPPRCDGDRSQLPPRRGGISDRKHLIFCARVFEFIHHNEPSLVNGYIGSRKIEGFRRRSPADGRQHHVKPFEGRRRPPCLVFRGGRARQRQHTSPAPVRRRRSSSSARPKCVGWT